jgi:DHA2 family multidrug resistance protein
VLGSRGVGTLVAMMAVGRLLKFVEARTLVFCGLALTAATLYHMVGFTTDTSTQTIVVTGIIQGAGLGFVFVPLSTITFATLAARYRNEGAAVFSLMRNIGSSVGISIVQALLTEGTARAHAELAVDISSANPVLQTLPPAFDAATPAGLAALNMEVTRQAAMIAYVADFRVMMFITLATIPLLLLIRKGAQHAAPEGELAEMAH